MMTAREKTTLITLFVIGIVISGFGVYMVVSGMKTNVWEPVKAKVVSTQVVKDVNHRKKHQRSKVFRDSRYSVQLRYSFEYQGVTYSSQRYSIGDGKNVARSFKTTALANQWLANSPYKSGAEIQIYANPDKPTESVVKPGLHWGTWIPLLIGLVFMLATVGYFRFLNNSN